MADEPVTDTQGLFLQTIYHPLRLYAEHTREVALDLHVESPAYDLPPAREEQSAGRVHHVADLGPFPLLDAVATRDEAGRQLTLAVVKAASWRASAARRGCAASSRPARSRTLVVGAMKSASSTSARSRRSESSRSAEGSGSSRCRR